MVVLTSCTSTRTSTCTMTCSIESRPEMTGGTDKSTYLYLCWYLYDSGCEHESLQALFAMREREAPRVLEYPKSVVPRMRERDSNNATTKANGVSYFTLQGVREMREREAPLRATIRSLPFDLRRVKPASNLPVAGIASTVGPVSIAALNTESYTKSSYKSDNPDAERDFKNDDNDMPDTLDTGLSTSIDSGNHERVRSSTRGDGPYTSELLLIEKSVPHIAAPHSADSIQNGVPDGFLGAPRQDEVLDGFLGASSQGDEPYVGIRTE